MEKFNININSNKITVQPVPAQHELFNISINARFIGYIDISVVGPTIQDALTLEEENTLRRLILSKEKMKN